MFECAHLLGERDDLRQEVDLELVVIALARAIPERFYHEQPSGYSKVAHLHLGEKNITLHFRFI